MVLNCNPENGNLITDTTARVMFYGLLNNINDIYVNARRTVDDQVAGNDNFDHLNINGAIFEKEYCCKFYEALWWMFLKNNENIVTEIKKYDDFDDGYDDGVINSTARVFRMVKKYGIKGLESNCKPFMIELREKVHKKDNDNKKSVENNDNKSFEELDSYIKKVIRINDDKSRREILEIIRNLGFKEQTTLERLLDVRMDEKDGDCSKEYLESSLRRIKREYERELNGEEE